MTVLTDLYLESLTPKERQAYLIAKDHLKSLFDLENTNGYLQWLQKYNAEQEQKSSSKTGSNQ